MRVIAGKSKGKKLKYPKLAKGKVRPLTDQAREALFNILGERVPESYFLDLFAGTGAVGIEALSRGATLAIFVEVNKRVVQVIRENLEIAGVSDRAEVYSVDALRAIKILDSKKARFDVIFIGPPYGSPALEEAMEKISNCGVLNKDGIIIAEHRAKQNIKEEFGNLKLVRSNRYGDTRLSFYKWS